MKTTNIFSRSLCIYDRQVTQILTRGWGVWELQGRMKLMGGVARVCARVYRGRVCVRIRA